MKYFFEEPLVEGIIVKRRSQFTLDVNIDGIVYKCHCPTTSSIADLVIKGLPCLLSKSNDESRNTWGTVEAISLNEPHEKNKTWIGINQSLSNKLIEWFLLTHQLNNIVSNYSEIHREVIVGNSRLDFLIDNSYLEVKTPLTAIHITYGEHIKTRKPIPKYTDRFVRHIKELTNSLKEHQRAMLVTVYQYEIVDRKPIVKNSHYDEIIEAISSSIKEGLEWYEITMKFDSTGVELSTCENITTRLTNFINK